VTDSENKGIIAAIHEIELRLTERLTRIEAEASAWRKTHDDLKADIERVSVDAKTAAAAVATTQAAETLRINTRMQEIADTSQRRSQEVADDCLRTTTRLSFGLVIVSILAAGRLAINIFQFFT
jgi:hypothetical protein